jgi:hypothetical protein
LGVFLDVIISYSARAVSAGSLRAPRLRFG